VEKFAADGSEGATSESLTSLRKAQVVLAHFAEVQRLQQGLPPSGYVPGTLGSVGSYDSVASKSRGSSRGGASRGASRGGGGSAAGAPPPTRGHAHLALHGAVPPLSPRSSLAELRKHEPELLPPRQKLPWIATRRPRPPPRAPFLDAGSVHDGPYVRRSGVGKHMTRAVHRLPPQASVADRVRLAQQRGDRFFAEPGDVNYEDWALGEQVSSFDGLEVRTTTLEPMTLCRAAFEDGAEALVDVMGAFRHRGDVQAFGLLNLQKYVRTGGQAACT